MSDITVVVRIQASPATVYGALCDIESWPEWTPTVVSVKRLDSGPLAVGSKALVKQPKLMPTVWQVTELQENANFTWEMRSPGIAVKGGHVVEPDEAGSKVTLTLAFFGLLGPLMGHLLHAQNERYVQAEADGLRRHCEGSYAVH